jgi:glycosyltransferase involved in cell wall biosynthesis
MFKVTIFTPTYNRSSTLKRLYISLLRQRFKDFEWLVVDDGSTDDTKELIQSFKNEGLISINYVYQENGGKHRAINNGLNLAEGEFFFIVDSDDYLTDNSLNSVLEHSEDIAHDGQFAGVVGQRQYQDGTIISTNMLDSVFDGTLIDRRYKFNIQGDMAKVIKTAVFRQFPFPDIKNEKFVAESLVWNRMAREYKFRYFNQPIYITEYLVGGLSQNSIRNRIKNPEYACLIYKELARNNTVPLKYRLKAAINYWRFALHRKHSFLKLLKDLDLPLISVVALPVGYLLYLKDKFKDSVDISIKR